MAPNRAAALKGSIRALEKAGRRVAITFRGEYTHRQANVPYFAGPGGVTPPGGNQGLPGSAVPGFTPDLQKADDRVSFAILVRI